MESFKNFNIFVERVRISLVQLKEYKANFYSVLFFDLVLSFVFVFFMFVFGDLIFDILGWEKIDLVIYYVALLCGAKIKWLFSLMFFSNRIITGDFNLVLTKPVNSFFFENLRNMTGATIITIPLMFCIFLGLSLVYGFNYFFIFLSSLILFFGVFCEVCMINFIESLAFFIKKNQFLREFLFKIIFANETYTPRILENLSRGFYLFSTSIYGFFVVEGLNGNFSLFILFLPWICLIYFGFIVGTYFLWKFGLVRYEAFG